MQNKTLKKMIKTTTKFINKNRHILCVIVCLVLVILLVDKLTGDIKENFICVEDNAVNISQCEERLKITDPIKDDNWNNKFCIEQHCPRTEPPH